MIENSAGYLDNVAFSNQERQQVKVQLAQAMRTITFEYDEVMKQLGMQVIDHSWVTGRTGAFNQLFPN